jgi:signal transduction histidine kinase
VSSPGRHLEAERDLPPLLEVLRKLYPQCRITAGYPPGLVMPQDRDDMLELLGNLLDNACKFSRGEVGLRIQTAGDRTTIIISDDGPGVPADRVDTLTLRGVRHDESVTGAGLGLSICRDICDSYDGEITFRNRPEGGLEVRVHLPGQSLA